jgi:transposase-like protein
VEKDGKRRRRRFSAEYKAGTVRLVQRSGKSIGQMALELGIGEMRAQTLGRAGRGRSRTRSRTLSATLALKAGSCLRRLADIFCLLARSRRAF